MIKKYFFGGLLAGLAVGIAARMYYNSAPPALEILQVDFLAKTVKYTFAGHENTLTKFSGTSVAGPGGYSLTARFAKAGDQERFVFELFKGNQSLGIIKIIEL